MGIKRKVHGVGYNSGGKHVISIKGMRTHTYMTWYNMMTRCYSKKLHERCPQYEVCEVSADWQDFQNFAEWYENHELSGLGYHLDKDLLVQGNHIYSAETCCLIPQQLNKIITTGRVRRDCMVGTFRQKQSDKWLSVLSIDNKQVYLGSFSTELEAHKAYIKAKERLVRERAALWIDKVELRAYEALTRWSYR